jgi:shikimate dehydrogenase
MRVFGLIGYPLTHSFSKKYFTEKFEKEHIPDCIYELFEIESVSLFAHLISSNPDIQGFNVTIPHKQAIMPLLDSLDDSAKFVGAVNVIKKSNQGKWIGYNSDYYGFMESLKKFLPVHFQGFKALVLGTGGAAKAVEAALKTLNIPYLLVSREAKLNHITYQAITPDLLADYQLIVNTTPLGMFPKVESSPTLPYQALTNQHYLFDLVYNPADTLFLTKGKEQGAHTQYGLEMLHLQAEKAWEIWNL